nr:efflux RND transporter periplasmic adaptor subunit [uncultured Noviherbaspirillum sp.]
MSEERHSGLGQQLPHAGSDGDLLTRRQLLRRARITVVVVLVLLGAGAARTIFSRMANADTLESIAATANKTYVRTTKPTAGGAGQTLVLPGTLQGYAQSPVAARASGYLKRWTTDIGSRVQKGDLLAEIETPEIDQQLSQAVAARAQTAASLALARSTMERWEALRKKDAVSQQDLDERRSAYAQAQANLASVDANIERLRQLGAFKRVTAPFAGVITRRNVEVGDLIDAGGGSGRALFVLTQTDPLRIYVNVPQSYAQVVRSGQAVKISQPELAGRSFEGNIARTAASIDASTRTMQVEIGLANPDNALLPGAYVLVSLPVAAGSTLTMSTNALILRSSGPQVAVVDQERRVRLKPVKIGRNFGQTVEVLEGVGPNDRLVQNPPDSLADNDLVEFAPDAPAAQNTAAAGGNRPAP